MKKDQKEKMKKKDFLKIENAIRSGTDDFDCRRMKNDTKHH